MAGIRDLAPKDTFADLMQMENGSLGLTTTLRAMRDGNGIASKLLLSTTAINLTGTVTNNGNAILNSVVAGNNVTVDNTDPKNPIVNASIAGGSTSALGTGAVPKLIKGAKLRQYGAAENNSVFNKSTSNGSAWFMLMPVMGGGANVTLTSIGVYLSATAANNHTLGFALYDANADGLPGALIFDTKVDIAVSTTASIQDAVISESVPEGWYWVCIAMDGSTISVSGMNDDVVLDGVMGSLGDNSRFLNLINTTVSNVLFSGDLSSGTAVWETDLTGFLSVSNFAKIDSPAVYIGR